jgi:hypothetical protein
MLGLLELLQGRGVRLVDERERAVKVEGRVEGGWDEGHR